MRGAVAAAEFAVIAARAAGAGIDELHVLCHRLRLAAEQAELSVSRSSHAGCQPQAAIAVQIENATQVFCGITDQEPL